MAQPQEEDIERASELVNSNGGKWGYITLIIQENDRDTQKWQTIFNQLRQNKLIPIIRIATEPEGSNWKAPNKEDAKEWVGFLSSLNWVVKSRYVILFNEPNHATEWGGEVNPQEYAEVAISFAKALKQSDANYVPMIAGLDASAPSLNPQYESETIFLRKVIQTIGTEEYEQYFDAWSSHSYPNPGFAGSPWNRGAISIYTYDWELRLLQSLGVNKELPVFITETGWSSTASGLEGAGINLKIAYESLWLTDNRVVAVTPFVLNYQSEPFLPFSWIPEGNNGFHPIYETIKNMKKTVGEPQIIESGEIDFDLPQEITVTSTYHFQVMIHNTGQSIWDSDEGYYFTLNSIRPEQYLASEINTVEPNQSVVIDVYFSTGSIPKLQDISFSLKKNNNALLTSDFWQVSIVPLPKLSFNTRLFPKLKSGSVTGEFQVFDEFNQLVYKKSSVDIREGSGTVFDIENIALQKSYRIVLLVPHYLPRQATVSFEKGQNNVSFKPMLPLDFNGDGTFSGADIWYLFHNPNLVRILLPF